MILLLCVGCQNKEQEEINDISNIDEYAYYTTMNCDILADNIKFFDNGWFVTENNDVYEYNVFQLYSNDLNCKKTSLKFPSDIIFTDWKNYFINSGLNNQMIYLDSNKNKIYYNVDNKKIETDIVNGSKQRYVIKNLLDTLSQNGYTKVHYRGTSSDGYLVYATKGDNNIYRVDLNFDIYGEDNATIIDENILFTLSNEEKILDFNFETLDYCTSFSVVDGGFGECVEERKSQYTNEITGLKYGIPENEPELFIETKDNYYRALISNEECEKYADVECVYAWKKDEDMTNIKNQIIYRDVNFLITKDWKVYSALGYGY